MVGQNALHRSQNYRNFATLINAGVPIIDGLESIALGLRGRDRNELEKTLRSLRGGLPLHRAVPEGSPLDRSLLKLGEANGNLTEILNYLASYYEERSNIQKAMKSACLKPAFLILSSLLLGSLPQLVSGELNFAQYLLKTVPPLLIVVSLGATLVQFIRSTDGAFLLKIPWIGKKVENFSLERFFLGLLVSYKAGASLDSALELSYSMVAIPNLRVAIQKTRARQGKMGFAAALATTQVIRERHLAELRTGEMAGTLETAFERIRQELRRENLDSIDQFVTWTPKIIYFLAMVYVGWGIVSSFRTILDKTFKEIPM